MRAKDPHLQFGGRGEQAIQAFQEANSLDAMTRLSHADDVVHAAEAKRARGKGEALLQPAAAVAVSAARRSLGTTKRPQTV